MHLECSVGTIKYGDQVFIRDPENIRSYTGVDPANVEKVVVNETEGKKDRCLLY